jgi:hypothetical protein
MPSTTTPTFLGLDVHKNTISAGILRPGEDVPDVEKISSDEESVRRLIDRLSDVKGHGCGPVTKRARRATSWPGCSGRSGSAAR